MSAQKRTAKKSTALVVQSAYARLSEKEILLRVLIQPVETLFNSLQIGRQQRQSILSSTHKNEDPLWLYFPGSRKPENRILLVTHLDTVRSKQLTEEELEIDGNIITARGGPLGADDRAGVAALIIMMREFGNEHSYLFTDLEECGGHGAIAAAQDIGDELGRHAYALEPDRFGDGQAVFYDETDGDGFEEYLGEVVPKFRFGFGSYTDIADICPEIGICGVNVSVGYMHQHTHSETLFIDAWERGLDNIRALLREQSIPEFAPRPALMGNHRWIMGNDDYDWDKIYYKSDDSSKVDKIPADDYWKADKDGSYWHFYNDGMVPIVNDAGDVIEYLDCKHMSQADWDLVDQHGAIDMMDMEMM